MTSPASATQRGAAPIRSYAHGAFDLDTVMAAKTSTGSTISVCIPARNEASTVGDVVTALERELVQATSLIDEIVVVDDHSTDDTAAIAQRAGARVVDAATVLTSYGEGHGKGEALWKSLYESTGDLVIWVDADITDFDPNFVVGMVGPLLTEPEVDFVKGHYRRPEANGLGGGRVTELLARPLLSLYFPELSTIEQPLAGEYGGRRSLLAQLSFVVGYGVDVALLIDAARVAGLDAIAQVDLGLRHHRNRTLDELGPQALAVGQAILDRAGVRPPAEAVLRRPAQEPLTVPMNERPPLASLPSR